MFSLKLLIASCLLAACLTSTCAAQKIITDRPDQTEGSTLIPKNTMQIEAGFNYGHVGSTENREVLLLLPTALLRIGLFEKFELRIVNQFMRIQNEALVNGHNGFGDVELGAKIQLFSSEEVNTEIALVTHVVLPFGSDQLTNSQLGIINKLSISHQLSTMLSLGYNIGYTYLNPNAQLLTYTAVLGFGLSERLGFYIEPYGEYVIKHHMLHNLNGGLTYLLKQNLQVDLSYGFGLNYQMQFAATGISWNFGY